MRQLNVCRGHIGVRACAAIIAAAATLSACADLRRAVQGADFAVNPESPVAPAAVAASQSNPHYPRMDKIPPVPTDIRPASAYKAAVIDEIKARRWIKQLDASLAAPPPDTDRFVQSADAALNKDKIEPPAEDQAARTEAFAAAARAAARPADPHSVKTAPPPTSPAASAPKPASPQP